MTLYCYIHTIPPIFFAIYLMSLLNVPILPKGFWKINYFPFYFSVGSTFFFGGKWFMSALSESFSYPLSLHNRWSNGNFMSQFSSLTFNFLLLPLPLFLIFSFLLYVLLRAKQYNLKQEISLNCGDCVEAGCTFAKYKFNMCRWFRWLPVSESG